MKKDSAYRDSLFIAISVYVDSSKTAEKDTWRILPGGLFASRIPEGVRTDLAERRYFMHEEYMRQALSIARFAEGRTSPNPMVGAVVVRDGRVVGQGWHRKAGTPHAEVHALRQADALASGADLYVTLEPCSHYGRTPPCAKAIIDAGVKRVVVAMTDPNPLVAGKGVAMLRQAGIEVIEDVLLDEAERLNEVFLKWIAHNTPFIVLKTAMTLDGKIATATGDSQWITGAAARRLVHEMRDIYDGILVGVGTVLADNPSLTARLDGGRGKNPLRIVVDSEARIPLTANLITDHAATTVIAVTSRAPSEKIKALETAGAEVLIVNDSGQVDLRRLFQLLGKQNITSVFVEGGAAINGTLLRERLIDKIHVFIAPKLVGGKTAPSPVGGKGIDALQDALRLRDVAVRMIGGDILISGYGSGEVE